MTDGAGKLFTRTSNPVTGPAAGGKALSSDICTAPGALDIQWLPFTNFGGGAAQANLITRLQKPYRNLYLLGFAGAQNFPNQAAGFRVFIHFQEIVKDVTGGFLTIDGTEPWFPIWYFGRFQSCTPFDTFYLSHGDFGGVEQLTLAACDDIELVYAGLHNT